MAKPVAVQPPLPNPTGNITNIALNNFDQDLVRALTSYLGGVALRLNATITNDGTEPMKADLDMGGYSITSVNNITGTGTATFATGEFTDLTVTNLTVTGTADLPPITDLTLTSLETDTLVVNTSATVPTPAPSDDSTAAATTEWVNDAIANIDTSTFVTLTGAQTITDKTLTEPIITLEQGSAPSATDSGRIQWDTDDNSLVVGTGPSIVRIRGDVWELIEDITFSAQTEVDILDLSAYTTLRLHGAISSTSTAGAPSVQLSSDNGATWITGSGYINMLDYGVSTGGGAAGAQYNTTSSGFLLAGANNIDSAVGEVFDMYLYNFNQAQFVMGHIMAFFRTPNPIYVTERTGLLLGNTYNIPMSAVRIVSTQNLNGHIIVEGIRG